MTVVDQAVGHRLNLTLFLGCDTLVVSDVEMGLFGSLLGTGLPDVWTKHPPTRSKDNVRPSMVSLKLSASILVDHTVNFASLEIIRIIELSIKNVKDNLTNFLDVYYLVLISTNVLVQVLHKSGAVFRSLSLFHLSLNFERDFELK